MLQEALMSLSPESMDNHISDLAGRCKTLEETGGWEVETGLHLKASMLHKDGSTEEQEEVEKDT
jgi:hypothetical protein